MSCTVAVLDNGRKRTFTRRENAVRFAASQARQAWVATHWTVVDNANQDRLSVSREGDVTAVYRRVNY